MIRKVPSGNIFLDPVKILKIADIGSGQKVADLGCGGAGYFVLQAGRMVGDKGMVYGIDILKSALSGLVSKIRLEGLTNVVPVWSDLEAYNGAKAIKDGSLDKALLIQLLFQSKNPQAILQETARMLKKGGWAVVVDWRKCDLKFSPPSQQCVLPEYVKAMANQTGFRLIKTFEAGKYHYGLIFEKV